MPFVKTLSFAYVLDTLTVVEIMVLSFRGVIFLWTKKIWTSHAKHFLSSCLFCEMLVFACVLKQLKVGIFMNCNRLSPGRAGGRKKNKKKSTESSFARSW